MQDEKLHDALSSASLEASDFSLAALESVLGLVRRRLWVIVALALALAAGGVYHAKQQPTIYRATSTLLLESVPRVVDKSTTVTADETIGSEWFVNSQLQILASERMANTVAKRIGAPAGSLTGRLVISPERSSQLMRLSVDDLEPQKAVTLVNAFTDTYVESSVSDHTGVARDAAEFLSGESKLQRDKLETDERALYAFQRDNSLPASNFEESHKIYASSLQALHAQLAAAFGTGVRLRARLEEVTGAKNNRDLLLLLSSPSTSEQGSHLSARYLQAVEQEAEFEGRYGPKHPKVLEARDTIDAIGSTLDREVATSIQALEAQLHGNASEQGQLKTAIATETQKAVALRQKELEYNRLKRQLDEDRESYDLVAKRHKEIEIQAALKQGFVRRLDAAGVATPVDGRVGQSGLIGLLAGLLLGVALAFLLDFFDDTLRSPHEADARLKEPVLGFVSDITAPQTAETHLVESTRAEYIVTYPRSVVAEQCHSISTNIASLFLTSPPRALAVVSSASRDGKTLTCINLAAAAAARGKRVVLVDADLRRGRLHSLFKLSRGGGLFELATGQITHEEATRGTWIPNVSVVTCGEVPQKVSPLRVLELEGLHAAVEALKERFDLVLFDTPPVPMLADALVMKDLFDGAIGVFRAGETSMRLSREMVRQLSFAHVNFVGWVLNGVSRAELKNKYYYRKYGYLSGYTSDGTEAA